jgi:GAF domain-containing protein
MAPPAKPDELQGVRRLWVRSVLARRPWSAWLPAGLAGVAVITALDVATGEHVALASALAIVALVFGLGGRRGDAIAVAGAAVAVAAISGLWNEWGAAYTVSLVVVVAASVVAVLVALVRASAIVASRQLRILRDLLALGRGAPDMETTIERVLGVVVPAFGDASVLDLEGRRAGVRALPSLGEQAEAALRDWTPPAATGADSAPRLVEPLDDEAARAAGLRAALRMPLPTRGGGPGALTVAVGPSGRRYSDRDVDFAELVGGRIAIVLENAGLTRQVRRTERRMTAALDTLDEAVTMNGPDGRTVYVNEAAVRLLKAKNPEELYSAQVGEISARFAIYDEQGRPLDYRALPAFRALQGEDHPPPVLVRNVVRATGEERWLVNRVSVLRDPHGNVDRVVNVIEDVTDVKQQERRQRLLAEATRVLSGSLDYEQTLQQVAEVAVPELADWCGVDLPGEDGEIDAVAIAHTDPEKVALGRELRERYPVRMDSPTDLAKTIRECRSHLVPSVADEEIVAFAADEDHLRLLRGVGFGSILVVPLVAGGAALGALTLVRSDPLRRFTPADVALAEELGQRAGIAVLNARLFTERATIARELQAGLMPPELARVPGLAAATLYRPAGELNEVGGDFYDAYATPGGWLTVIGDVAGQGARAAALTGLARFTVRSVAQLTGDLLAAAAQVNRTLREQPELSLVTIAMALVERDDAGGLVLATVSCGHPLPVLIREGRPVELGRSGPLAGAFADAGWELTRTPLRTGDVVVLYTDGVLDTVGADDRFGEARLFELLAHEAAGPEALVERVHETLEEFRSGPQADDTAMVVLQVREAVELAGAIAAGRPDGERVA